MEMKKPACETASTRAGLLLQPKAHGRAWREILHVNSHIQNRLVVVFGERRGGKQHTHADTHSPAACDLRALCSLKNDHDSLAARDCATHVWQNLAQHALGFSDRNGCTERSSDAVSWCLLVVSGGRGVRLMQCKVAQALRGLLSSQVLSTRTTRTRRRRYQEVC